MKLLISDETLGQVPAPRDRNNPFALRLGDRGAQREYDDNTISQLTDIGFSRRLALDALNRNRGNIEMSIEHLLTLPPSVIEEDRNRSREEEEGKDESSDVKMEDEQEEKKQQDVNMDKENTHIVVCDSERLQKEIKHWLKMLFNWVLKGFNSNLTDIDVENITQFILKYISTEEDVVILMDALVDSLKEMKEFFHDNEKDINDAVYQKRRKTVLKKASTLSKIISHIPQYYPKKLKFIKELHECIISIFDVKEEQKLNFIPKDKEHIAIENLDIESPKIESEIFMDVIGNSLNIIIAGYGFYKLAKSDEIESTLHKEFRKNEEEKKEENKGDKKEVTKDVKEDKNDTKAGKSIYDDSVTKYLTGIEAFNTSDLKEIDVHFKDWKDAFKETDYLQLLLKIIEYCIEDFDQCLAPKDFNKLLYFLNKVLEEKENVTEFNNQTGFKKLLAIKSRKKKVVDSSKQYFSSIVNKLIENEDAQLEITENMIRKCFYFKHDEEFSKETKDIKSQKGSKKRNKNEGKKSKDKPLKVNEDVQEDVKEDSKEEVKADTKDKTNVDMEESPKMKKSASEEDITTEAKPPYGNSKSTNLPQSTVIKKSDIQFNAFKNCSGVKLNQFIDQMKHVEFRSPNVFFKACKNLCEIENVKEYDVELNVKSQYKIIKLKDSVLKEYISKTAKESTTNYKNQPVPADKKDLNNSQDKILQKSGSNTARPKQSSTTNILLEKNKDNFLISSLMTAQSFLPKPNRYIILMILDKIVDKYINKNIENWEEPKKEDEHLFISQCVFSYSTLISILTKIIATYPSTTSLLMLFKSKKLRQFPSFTDFLVRLIYPIGFQKWVKYDEDKHKDRNKLQELWTPL